MVWTLFDLKIQNIKDFGSASSISGTCAQRPGLQTLPELNSQVADLLRDARAEWRIISTNAPDIDIDAISYDPINRVRAHPDLAHYKISFYPKEDDRTQAVYFTFILPPDHFSRTYQNMWGIFSGQTPSIGFSIQVDYLGFKAPIATTDNITFEEWTNEKWSERKSICGVGVSINFSKL